MLRWTSNHPIPFGDSRAGRIFSTKIGKNIWMMLENPEQPVQRRMNLYVFDTENKTFNEVPTLFNGGDIQIHFINSIGNVINVWAIMPTENDDDDNLALYEIDINNLVWTREESARVNVDTIVQIIASRILYIMERTADSLMISMVENGRAVIFDQLEEFSTPHLISFDNQLHLIEHTDTNRRTWNIDNFNINPLMDNNYQNDAGDLECIYHGYDQGLIYVPKDPKAKYFYLDKFDTEECKFVRRRVEKSFRSPKSRIQTSYEIDGKLYAITACRPKIDCNFEIKVLDLDPTLTTICLLDIVDQSIKVNNPVRTEAMVNRLPIGMRLQFKNIYGWKSKELDFMKRVGLKRKHSVDHEVVQIEDEPIAGPQYPFHHYLPPYFGNLIPFQMPPLWFPPAPFYGTPIEPLWLNQLYWF